MSRARHGVEAPEESFYEGSLFVSEDNLILKAPRLFQERVEASVCVPWSATRLMSTWLRRASWRWLPGRRGGCAHEQFEGV